MNMLKKLKLRILGALVLVPLAIMSGCTGDTNTPATTGTGNDSVQGVVVDTASGKAIAGATVKSGWATAVTDKSGVFNLGTAPYTINTGNIAMPDATYVVAIDTTSATGLTGYTSTYFRRVNVAQAGTDANILRIGKTNSTVKGMVLNANQTFATNALVTLTYLANGGNEGTANNNSPIVTASSLSTVTATDGTYTITGVETGSRFQLMARSADGNYTTTGPTAYGAVGAADYTMPPVDGYTFAGTDGGNNTRLTFNALPDGIQPLRVLGTTTIAVGTAAATAANLGDYTAGTTVVTFNFNKAVKATAYTATTGVYQLNAGALNLNSVLNDVSITQAAKTGNIPYAVQWGADMKSLQISFTSSPSMVYTVSIQNVVNKLQDSSNAWYNGAAAQPAFGTAVANSQIVFSTSGSPAVGTVSNTLSRTTGTIAGDSLVNYNAVTNATLAYIYVKTLVNGVATVDYTAFNSGAVPPVKTPFGGSGSIQLNFGGPNFNTVTALSAFETFNADYAARAAAGFVGTSASPFFSGLDKYSYMVKVVYLNNDKLELADKSIEITVDDKTKPTAVLIATDKTNAGGAALTLFDTTVNADPNAGGNVVARAVTSKNADATLDRLPVVAYATPASVGVPANNYNGGYTSVVNSLVPATLIAVVTFDDQMDKASVEATGNWGIADIAKLGTTADGLSAIAPVVSATVGTSCLAGAANPCLATVTAAVSKVVYNQTTFKATITYTLNWQYIQSAAEAAAVNPGAIYTIPVPQYLFTFAGTDLNGNVVKYPAFPASTTTYKGL